MKYFTAAVPETDANPLAAKRQASYWKALRSTPKVQLEVGHVAIRRRSARLADGSGFVSILHREEKGSDVNLASALLIDHFLLNPDLAIVISDDTDLESPVAMVRARGQHLQIFSPRGMQLERLGCPEHRARKLRHSVLVTWQFPDRLVVHDGTTLVRPEPWS